MVRREILPLALIGVGLAWLALGRKESGDLLRRLSDGLAHVQSIAREFHALAPKCAAAVAPSLTDAWNLGGGAAPIAYPES